MKLLAKNFVKRSSLEKAIQGLGDPKTDVIEGKRDELARLGLSDRTTIFGVKVVITDTPTKKETFTHKPERGERKQGGIVGK